MALTRLGPLDPCPQAIRVQPRDPATGVFELSRDLIEVVSEIKDVEEAAGCSLNLEHIGDSAGRNDASVRLRSGETDQDDECRRDDEKGRIDQDHVGCETGDDLGDLRRRGEWIKDAQ